MYDMLKSGRFLFVCMFVCFATCGATRAVAQILSGSAAVNVTSETAAAAKSKALNDARRQILRNALGPYTNKEQLADAMDAANSADLADLILTSSIDGERQSATSYTATITMTVDAAAARKWLADNNVQSWLPDASGGDKFIVVVNMRDRVADWMQLNQIARGENVDLNTKNITGNTVMIELPMSQRPAFTAAARAAGWQYRADADVLRLWK